MWLLLFLYNMSLFRFAHISDVHLPPLPKASMANLLSKRILGYLSWHRKRKHQHKSIVLEALIKDLNLHDPDHICVTGDITNIALEDEFKAGAEWLSNLAPQSHISLIPGNHDAYVDDGLTFMRQYWTSWMGGDDLPFPFVHKRGGVAFVGVSTAIPTGPFMAYGRVGQAQRERLERTLHCLKEEGYFRVVMLHHSSCQGVEKWRKSLLDAPDFRAVLGRVGANLVLHGHKHHPVQGQILGPENTIIPVFGAGAASLFHENPLNAAHYHLFELHENTLHIKHRHYDARTNMFITLDP